MNEICFLFFKDSRIKRSGGKPGHGAPVREHIAEQIGCSEDKVKRLRTLADLIPELSRMRREENAHK